MEIILTEISQADAYELVKAIGLLWAVAWVLNQLRKLIK